MPTTQSLPTHALKTDDLIRLGQSGESWGFLEKLAASERSFLDDGRLVYLAALNLGRLGLPDLAAILLRSLSKNHADDRTLMGQALELTEALKQIPTQRLSLKDRLKYCQQNLDALGEKAEHVHEQVDAWKVQTQSDVYHIARDGNIVIQAADSESLSGWQSLCNLRSLASSIVLQYKEEAGPESGPIVIEGLSPPWLLENVYEQFPPGETGYALRVSILQADAMQFLDGLSMADLSRIISEDRFHFYISKTCGLQLSRWFEDNLNVQAAGPCFRLPSTRLRCTPAPERVIAQTVERQLEHTASLRTTVLSYYADKGCSYWANRFAEAMPGRGQPLRVLIPTSLFSTFVRFSSSDMARALERKGCHVRLFMEPDYSTRLNTAIYLEEINNFKPDLIILINYPRAVMNGLVPENVPYLCWVQDAMPHLFDRSIGEASTPLDFYCGLLPADLFTKFGYPRSRSVLHPIAVDTHKFHSGSVPGALRDRYACDLAIITHHSQTPDDLHNQLCREAEGNHEVVRIFKLLQPQIHELVHCDSAEPLLLLLKERTQNVLDQVLGHDHDHRIHALVRNNYVDRLADRMLRHRVLSWAAAAADKNGWDFRIYGNGWEKHPEFSQYNAGPLEHGEDLRCAYQAAKIQLHVSLHGTMHQRVFESALSGGLPVCYRTFSVHRTRELYRFLVETDPDVTKDGMQCYDISKHPAVMSFVSRQREFKYSILDSGVMCLTSDGMLGIDSNIFQKVHDNPKLDQPGSDEILTDLKLTTFACQSEFNQTITALIENNKLRSNLSVKIANNVKSFYSNDVMATNVLEYISQSFV